MSVGPIHLQNLFLRAEQLGKDIAQQAQAGHLQQDETADRLVRKSREEDTRVRETDAQKAEILRVRDDGSGGAARRDDEQEEETEEEQGRGAQETGEGAEAAKSAEAAEAAQSAKVDGSAEVDKGAAVDKAAEAAEAAAQAKRPPVPPPTAVTEDYIGNNIDICQ